MASSSASSATPLTTAWEEPKQQQPQPRTQAPPQGLMPFAPRQMLPPPPMQFILPPQQQAPPPEPQIDVLGEMSGMLSNTEQYLLRQFAELLRASHGQLGKALTNHLPQAVQENRNQSQKAMLIAILVVVALILIGMVIGFWKVGKALSAFKHSFVPHPDLVNLNM